MRMASASSTARYTCATGPKSSSREISLSGVTLLRTAAGNQASLRSPAEARVAP